MFVFALFFLFFIGIAFLHKLNIFPFNETKKVTKDIPKYCNGVPFSECETELSKYDRSNFSTCEQECLNVKNDDTCNTDYYTTWKECTDTGSDHRQCFNDCGRTDGLPYELSYPNHEKTGAYCNGPMKHWCTDHSNHPPGHCESNCYDFSFIDLCYGNDDYDTVNDCFVSRGAECITDGVCKTFNNENYKRTFN